MDFPTEHGRRIHSTNVVQRLHRELRWRFDGLGIFPNVAAALRLLGAVLEERHEEWMVSGKYFGLESMAKLRHGPEPVLETHPMKEVVRES